jgi:hypothetical protein
VEKRLVVEPVIKVGLIVQPPLVLLREPILH